MKKSARFCFEVGKRNAVIFAKALEPESRRAIPRTTVKMKVQGDKFILRIDAEDTNALRAAINSYLRWIKCAAEVIALSER